MNQHFEIWIDAYLDGELNERQIEKFEKHLQTCPECLVQLEEREKLSGLLKNFSLPESDLSTEQFVHNVNLLLPRIQPKPRKKPGTGGAWIMISLGLLAILAFTQAINWLNNLLLLIPGLDSFMTQVVTLPPFIEKAIPWFFVFVKQWSTFSGWGYFYTSLTFTSIVLPGLLSMIYLSWLVFWWDNQFIKQ